MNFKNKLSLIDEEAYWISPEGAIISVVKSHIDLIFDNPSLFELEMDYIKSVYDRHNEEYRIEGKAREEILLLLFQKGWIRVRRYHRPCHWSLNVYCLNDNSVERIKCFASLMINIGHSPYDDVMLDTPKYRKVYSMGELMTLKPFRISKENE